MSKEYKRQRPGEDSIEGSVEEVYNEYDEESDENEFDEEERARQSRQAMEFAAEVVLQADKLDSETVPTVPVTTAGEDEVPYHARPHNFDTSGDKSSDDPPVSVIAVGEESTAGYYDDLDSSITQSVARGGRTTSTEDREERFLGRIAELLANMQEQGQNERSSQPAPATSNTGQPSEANDERLNQIAAMLENIQKQQYETFRQYEEQSNAKQPAKPEAEPDSTSPPSSGRTTSTDQQTVPASNTEPKLSPSDRVDGNVNVLQRSPLPTKTLKDPPSSPVLSTQPLQSPPLPRKMSSNRPKPDPPAMEVLVKDVLEKLEPDGTISTYEIDPNAPQERLTPVHSLRRVMEEPDEQEDDDDDLDDDRSNDMDKKMPARDISQPSFTPETESVPVTTSAAQQSREPNVEAAEVHQGWETRAAAQVGAIPVRDMELNIWAPPGQLEISFAEDTEPPTIRSIHRSSPVLDSLEVGDMLVAVDDEDVRWMSSIMVNTLLTFKNGSWRELRIRRSVREGSGQRPVNRKLVGRESKVVSTETDGTEASTNETSDESRARHRAEVESLVRTLVPEELDNVDTMMEWFSGREGDLVSTLRNMQDLRSRGEDEDDESSTIDSASRDKRRSQQEARKERAARQPPTDESNTERQQDADTKSQLQSDRASARETVAREPPGVTPVQPRRTRTPPPPGAVRVGGLETSDDTTVHTVAPTVAAESDVTTMTASIHRQQPVEATLVSSSDPDAQLTRLTEAVASIQHQQQELLEATRRANNRGPSCRDRFEMFITCLFCLRTRPVHEER